MMNKDINYSRVLFLVILITASVQIGMAVNYMYKEWKTGCFDVLPKSIEKTYKTDWKICRGDECTGVTYITPESRIDTFHVSPYNDCVYVYEDGTLTKWCGGEFKITKVGERVKNHGYQGGWFEYICVDVSEIDYQIEQAWLGIDAKCVHLLQQTGESCDCGGNPMGCIDYLSSLLPLIDDE